MSLVDLAERLASSLPGKAILSVPIVKNLVSKLAIEHLASQTPPRPRPLSLWSEVPKSGPIDQAGPVSDYTSWPGLTDRTFSSRHLPPADSAFLDTLPPFSGCNPKAPLPPVVQLFQRQLGGMKKDRSSVLFMFFAQWFTDSFLRTDPEDRRKNTSNHEIDLCQIYGLTESTARMLRSMTDGKLSSQMIGGEEFPDALYELDASNTPVVRQKYLNLPFVVKVPSLGSSLLETILQGTPGGMTDARRLKLYATGLERGNSSIGYVAISTIFLREHNRLCSELKQLNPGWGDERLFQTARLINIAIVLRIVIEDYINHIAGNSLFVFDNSFAEDQNWYRTNWMSIEFDMLYRWHGLVPDTVNINNKAYKPQKFMVNNQLLEEVGIAALIDGASREQAGKIGLFNTPDFLIWADCQNVKMGRDFRLRSFNDYRDRFGFKPLGGWDDLTSDQQTKTRLQALYGTVDKLELIVGLFAEEPKAGALFGELMTTMVAVDAFTQALTNPILSQHVFTEKSLTQYGLDQVSATPSLEALIKRNVQGNFKVSFNWP